MVINLNQERYNVQIAKPKTLQIQNFAVSAAQKLNRKGWNEENSNPVVGNKVNFYHSIQRSCILNYRRFHYEFLGILWIYPFRLPYVIIFFFILSQGKR